jgi:hypothetical protein
MIFNYKISTENINKFPRKRVIEIFEPYLKKYLLARYSYCSDIRNKNKHLLTKSLKNFSLENIGFGRKIISLKIFKLYYISELYYNYSDKQYVFLRPNVYIPHPSMIFLLDKCYVIDIREQKNKYSIFPNFSTKQNLNDNNYTTITCEYVNNYVFTDTQIEIIKNEIKPKISNIFDEIKNIAKNKKRSFTSCNFENEEQPPIDEENEENEENEEQPPIDEENEDINVNLTLTDNVNHHNLEYNAVLLRIQTVYNENNEEHSESEHTFMDADIFGSESETDISATDIDSDFEYDL